MTEKQKKAFLKAEGWWFMEYGCGHGWRDPVHGDCWAIEGAYRIASRRRRQREARALRKAGWRPFGRTGIWTCWRQSFRTRQFIYRTRQEALYRMERQP